MTLSVRARAGGAPFVGVLAFLSAAYVASGVFVGKRDGRGAGGGFLEAHPQERAPDAGVCNDCEASVDLLVWRHVTHNHVGAVK